MARTKASVGAKISSGKSSKARCSVAPPPPSSVPSGSGERSSRNYSGGNSVCPRETPKWQKPITNFFICMEKPNGDQSDTEAVDQEPASSSRQKQKRNVIESDEDCEGSPQKRQESIEYESTPPKNQELDESILLAPLSGENSHKMDEYYSKHQKGKGKGKKTKDKENLNNNIERRSSVKRDLEAVTFGEESLQASKKVKV